MTKNCENYYLGLDIQTNSVGWAVTDKRYNLLKSHGKTMWGIRLFEQAKTAKERKEHRAARRRLIRKKQRIKQLDEFFEKDIIKIDPGFYLRLEESKFWSEDKTENQKNTLFNDKDYTDKNFHKEYPTFYHLRKALIEEEQEFDVRLVYLAIHHIFKKRGHFLFDGEVTDDYFEKAYNDLEIYCREEKLSIFECKDVDLLKIILKDTAITNTAKMIKLTKLLNVETKQEKAWVALFIGETVKLPELYQDENLDNSEITKICFSDGSYDEMKDDIEYLLGNQFTLIQKVKSVYDGIVLEKMLKGENYLSFAKVRSYDEHNEDLHLLKKAIKEYCPDKYKYILTNDSQKNNYAAYIGNSNGKKIRKCTQENLCKFLERIFKDYNVDKKYNQMMKKIKSRTFLPKQDVQNNSVIPYQLNKKELHMILMNASKYLSFLNEIDDTGLSVSKKIEMIFEFRIPCYVGPLNDAHGDMKNCWIKRNPGMEHEKIYPWNFKKVIDIQECMDQFVKRSTNRCVYLTHANALPKNSLLYSEYMLLNELNNIKINHEPIKVEIKNRVIDELFKKQKKVTMDDFKNWLHEELGYDQDIIITGIDGDFKTNLAAYIDFQNILNNKSIASEIIEELILWIVIFGNDKNALREMIKEKYSDKLLESEIKKISQLTYKEWGRVSREFLTEIYIQDEETENKINVISKMRQCNLNILQLLVREYNYIDEIKRYNQNYISEKQEFSISLLDDLYLPPVIKRSVWQTLQIVREIEKVMGHEPKRIFIKMLKGEKVNKTQKLSKKNKLLELYENYHEDTRDWINEIEKEDESAYRSKRLYLYYTQMGRCMYSGAEIALDDLYSELYDIDHIYPRSKVKDDDLDNQVLVKRKLNQEKANNYPISLDIRKKMQDFWKTLWIQGFISKKKYDHLTGETKFSEDKLIDFISNHTVEIKQSIRSVESVLRQLSHSSEVVYAKADDIAEFRNKNKMIKVREINDYHFAQDAYLSIVVGNTYFTKFTNNPKKFIKSNNNYDINTIYNHDILNEGEVVWKGGITGSIATVKKTMKKNNILFTRYARENKGKLFDQMPVKAGKGQMPLKMSDDRLRNQERYGGYNRPSGAYFFLVEHEDKNKNRIRSIEYVPIYMAKKFLKSTKIQQEYCIDKLGLKKCRILIPKIKINTLFEVDGFRMHLTGRTANRLLFKGAMPLILGEDQQNYFKKICKIYKQNQNFKVCERDGITREKNIILYDTLLSKLEKTKYKVRLSAPMEILKQGRDRFLKLSLEQQSGVLYQELYLFSCNVGTADLSLVGGPRYSGKMVISNKITNYTDVKIIHQSITGIFENEVDLLKV